MSTTVMSPRPSAASRLEGAGRWLPLPILLTALFVITLDFFIVNVALPSMTSELGAGSASVQLWVAGYGVTFGALLVLGGRLGDLHGRRRMFVGGIALFTLASAACGIAPSAGSLVAARIAQGVGAALLSPQILATIGVTYFDTDRVRALTAFGLTAGLAAVSGQLIGGALIEADVAGLGWRACFLVNVPLGLVAIALAHRTIPESRSDDRRALDGPSVALVTAGLALVVLPLVEGRELGWPVWTWVSLGDAALLLGVFWVRQRRLAARGAAPLIDPELFADRAFTLGAVTTLVFQTTVASSFFVLALLLQGGLGFGALESGLVCTILAVGYLAASIAAPALEVRIGRLSLLAGAVISAIGWGELAAAAGGAASARSAGPLVPGLLVAGVGMGLLFAPLVTATLATVAVERAGAAAGVVNTVQQVGGAVGVALLGIVFYGVLAQGSPADHAAAFSASAWCLAGTSAVVAALVALLPRRAPAKVGSTP